jgi:hypothetical protein
MALTVEQMQTILEHDSPTDMWLLHEDGTITAEPDGPIDEYLRHDTWPRYLCRSESIDNLVTAVGADRALQQVNMLINNNMLGQPSPKMLARSVIQALKRST